MYSQPSLEIRRAEKLIEYTSAAAWRVGASRFFFARELKPGYRGVRGPWFCFWCRENRLADTKTYYAHMSQFPAYVLGDPIVAATLNLDTLVVDVTPSAIRAGGSRWMKDLTNVQIVRRIPVPG